jgi:hypothetical protein
VGSPNPSPKLFSRASRCVQRIVLYLQDLMSFKMGPRWPRSVTSGEAPPRERSPASNRRPRAPLFPWPSNLMSTGEIRSRTLRSEPRDRDPRDLNRAYRFGVGVNQSRQIWSRRSRLDPFKYGLGPFDLDPTVDRRAYRFAVRIRSGPLMFDPRAQNRRYPFSPLLLLKSPRVFRESTRAPV